MVEHGFFQCHAVHLAGAERLEVAADVLHARSAASDRGLNGL